MDQTKSKVGRQRLREWMLKPLVDVRAILLRQDGTELFQLPEFQDVMGTISKLLERVGGVDKIIRRMEKCATQPQDFSILARSIQAALQICEILEQDILWILQNSASHEQVDSYIAFVQSLLQNCSTAALQELYERLSAAIDDTATNEWSSQTMIIRDGFSEELDMMRDQYHQLVDILEDVRIDLVRKLPRLSEFIDFVFFPQVRRPPFFVVVLFSSLSLVESHAAFPRPRLVFLSGFTTTTDGWVTVVCRLTLTSFLRSTISHVSRTTPHVRSTCSTETWMRK